jgi:glycosyltransferase involved in cell wall biosynthesis
VASGESPSFDLVVATVDRVDEPRRLFASLAAQTYPRFRVLLVDQNDDDRLDAVVRQHASLDVDHIRSPRGLSRARNVALRHISADVVAFPDDDCVYASDLLERVARRFAEDLELDGLTGRAVDSPGNSSRSWAREGAQLTRENLWNRAISFTIFLRSPVVEAVGFFDERLGLGSSTPWSSGEETEYLVRAVDTGARIEYDPDLVVAHDDKASPESRSGREGAAMGYILRKHGYPVHTVGRMLVRPLGGALVALARRDATHAQFHLATLRGRVRGYWS